MLSLLLAAATIPFQLQDHRIFVRTTINAAGPFAMIVDTGSPGLTITPEVASRLKIGMRSAGPVTGAAGSAPASKGHVGDVRVGSVDFGGAQTDVIDLGPIRRAIGFRHLDGIIGYDQLRRYRVLVDMDRRTVTFSPGTVAAPAGSANTPFTLDGGQIEVAASVNGVRGTFFVDTGDRSNLTLFQKFAREHGFYRSVTVRNAVTGYGIGGPISSDLLRSTVQAFGVKVGDVRTRVSLARGGVFASSGLSGSIGNGFLERLNVIYDYPDRQIVSWRVARPVPSTSLLREPPIPQPT